MPTRAIGNGTDDMLHWMLWNIPRDGDAACTSTAPAMSQLPDGTRQISATGPYYRGPGAPASGPAHHYVFELFALDTMLDVPAVGASPPATRAAVVAAMAGHIRGKAVSSDCSSARVRRYGDSNVARSAGLPDGGPEVRTTSMRREGFAPFFARSS